MENTNNQKNPQNSNGEFLTLPFFIFLNHFLWSWLKHSIWNHEFKFPLAHGEKTNPEVQSLNICMILAWNVLTSFLPACRRAHAAGTVHSLPDRVVASVRLAAPLPRTTERFSEWKRRNPQFQSEKRGIEVISRDSLYRSSISFTAPDLLPYTTAHRICFPLWTLTTLRFDSENSFLKKLTG